MKKNIVFLPCRKGSQRIPHKNTKDFAGIKGGLLHIKLQQLLATPEIDEIILSSDDEEVLAVGKAFNDNRIILSRRPDELCTSQTTTDSLIAYVPSLIAEDATIIWTHVTSPFLSAETYSQMIKLYYEGMNQYDSLMSVNPLRTFIWNEQGAINYDREQRKWPQTQTLPVWYEVNSGVFIADIETYRKRGDRIGEHVQLYETSKLESLDIDWPEDFEFAELLYTYQHKK